MKVITERNAIKQAREHWKDSYARDSADRKTGWCSKTFGQIRTDLDALDIDSCSVEDLAQALGTTGWGLIKCDECGERQNKLVRMGEKPDYEARWQDICAHCLDRGLDIISSA